MNDAPGDTTALDIIDLPHMRFIPPHLSDLAVVSPDVSFAYPPAMKDNAYDVSPQPQTIGRSGEDTQCFPPHCPHYRTIP